MDSLDNRYAVALLNIAQEENLLVEYRETIKEIQKCLVENEEYLRVLSSSFINKEEKFALIEEAFKSLPFRHIISFLKVIIDNHRVEELPRILEEFISLGNAALGVEEGYVYSVVPLTKHQLDEICQAIGQRLHKKVELKNVIDPSLIGGIKVIIHDRIFDGTLSRKLTDLASSLLEGKVINNEN